MEGKNDKPEIIISSAIKTKSGNIYTGLRHPQIRADILGKEPLSETIDGFMTDKGNFLNRKDAAKLVRQTGQGHMHTGEVVSEDVNELYSEDLW